MPRKESGKCVGCPTVYFWNIGFPVGKMKCNCGCSIDPNMKVEMKMKSNHTILINSLRMNECFGYNPITRIYTVYGIEGVNKQDE